MTGFPTGAQYELRAGRTAAVVTEVGGGLRTLVSGGRDLVAGFAAAEPRPVYRGAVLVPWANRPLRDEEVPAHGLRLTLQSGDIHCGILPFAGRRRGSQSTELDRTC